MLVDEQFRQCAALLFIDGTDDDTGEFVRKPVGSAFLISVDLEDDKFSGYVVTARHVVISSRPHGPLYIRLNKIDGGFEDVAIPDADWVENPDTDVAVAEMPAGDASFDWKFVPLDMLATDDFIAARGVGSGDEVFFVGLFSLLPGRERAEPIVRFGNISLMPQERIPVRLEPDGVPKLVDAYLVEARSWGGQSGSPAFIYFSFDRTHGSNQVGEQDSFRLLGLVHGHHDIEQPVSFSGDISEGAATVPINAGIAVLIPAQAIIDTLMQEELVARREELDRRITERRTTPTPDTADEAPGH